jgi:hypothetical protein
MITLDEIATRVSYVIRLVRDESYQDALNEERSLWLAVLEAIARGDAHTVGDASDMARIALKTLEAME